MENLEKEIEEIERQRLALEKKLQEAERRASTVKTAEALEVQQAKHEYAQINKDSVQLSGLEDKERMEHEEATSRSEYAQRKAASSAKLTKEIAAPPSSSRTWSAW